MADNVEYAAKTVGELIDALGLYDKNQPIVLYDQIDDVYHGIVLEEWQFSNVKTENPIELIPG